MTAPDAPGAPESPSPVSAVAGGGTGAPEAISARLVRAVAEDGCEYAPDVCKDCLEVAAGCVVAMLRELARADLTIIEMTGDQEHYPGHLADEIEAS